MPRTCLLSIIALSLWPAAARAVNSSDFVLNTTEDLYVICSTADNDPLRTAAINYCEGFLLGVVTYQDAIADANPRKRLICYPQGVTRNDGIQAFVDWAARHQQENDDDDPRQPPIRAFLRAFLLGSVVIAKPELADARRRGLTASEANGVPRFWWLRLL